MLVALATVLLLAGCTGASESGGDSGTSTGMPDIGAPGMDGPVTDGFGGGSLPGEEFAEEGGDGRQVIEQGYLAITADDPIEAADDAAQLVEDAGGRVDSRSEQPPVEGGGDEGGAQLVVRIPSDVLDETIDEIKELGELEQVQLSSTDVTAQTQDLDARITALQASVDRLLALLASATSTADLITIETALSERQADLESFQAQRRGLGEQVDFATVSVDFGSEATAPADTPRTFFSAVAAGWEALVGFVGAAAIAFGLALPWLVVTAIIAGLVLLVVRLVRRPGRVAPAAAPVEEPEGRDRPTPE